MKRKKREFTVGELAKTTGLTVRALQHYDNIGLLPASGRTEGGRRFYTDNDMLKLEQIVFYKSLGIPLIEIKEKLIESPSLYELETIFLNHESILIKKIETLHTGLSVINASLNVIRSGSYPPWEILISLIQILESSNLEDWANYKFDKKITKSFMSRGMDTGKAMELYHSIKNIQIEAIMLSSTGYSSHSSEAQDLGKRWWKLIIDMANGEEQLFESLASVNENRDSWPEADRKLFEIAEPFIEAALAVYIEKNDIEVPKKLWEGKYNE